MSRAGYINAYMNEKYDRINFVIPKGQKDKIKEIASSLSMSVNEYLYALICNDAASGVSMFGMKKQGFDEEQKRMLEKWQVPKKYYEMIEDMSYSKEEGYFIYLKSGYINDVTMTRSIHCHKTSELRQIINKSHKK